MVLKCTMTGSKRRQGKDIDMAAVRILEEDLAPLSCRVAIGTREKAVELATDHGFWDRSGLKMTTSATTRAAVACNRPINHPK